jgi:metal-dependent hydrolase (beta-lactamase superfamily II)
MIKLRSILLISLVLATALCCREATAQQEEIINTYNILEEDSDNNIPRELGGVSNALIISEHVDKKTPLYKIISGLKMEEKDKKKALENITDGALKIYFDLGGPWGSWENNYVSFENKLRQTSLEELSGPPDLIILSHAHWPNYIGGLEYLQRKYPYVPVLVTPDMKEGLICFDWSQEKGPMEQKHTNGRIVKIKNPIMLEPGTTVLTKHLSIITQEYRHKWPNLCLQNGKILINEFKTGPEYENILAIDTKKGVAMFTTCMHSSFLEAVKKTIKLYNKKLYLYCGGFEDSSETIAEAKKISPPLEFLFYHCADIETLTAKFGKSFIKRINLGEKIFLDL